MILQFQNVRCDAAPDGARGLSAATFALKAGELLLLRVDSERERTPIPDLAQGLLLPDAGSVAFEDAPWPDLPPGRAAAQRHRIGRVFDSGAWLSNLDVDENITLAQRYHTAHSEPEILAAARNLAREFGMDDLPAGRPHAVNRDWLQRAQWVRAFLGEPSLLLFEHPARDVAASAQALLVARTRQARAAGAAVLWITAAPAECRHPALEPTLYFELKETTMRRVAQTGTEDHGQAV